MSQIAVANKDKIKIADNDNIIVNKRQIVGTDFDKILNYVTLKTPPVGKKPKGVVDFLIAIGKAGISDEFVPNAKLKKIMLEQKGGGKRKRAVVVKWISL